MSLATVQHWHQQMDLCRTHRVDPLHRGFHLKEKRNKAQGSSPSGAAAAPGLTQRTRVSSGSYSKGSGTPEARSVVQSQNFSQEEFKRLTLRLMFLGKSKKWCWILTRLKILTGNWVRSGMVPGNPLNISRNNLKSQQASRRLSADWNDWSVVDALGSALCGSRVQETRAQMEDLEKETRRWWFSPKSWLWNWMRLSIASSTEPIWIRAILWSFLKEKPRAYLSK